MATARIFPFRWLLPVMQLWLCLLAIWPSRYLVLFEMSQSIESYFPARRSSKDASPPVNIQIPGLITKQQADAEVVYRMETIRMTVPAMLNLPVLLVQMPYVLSNPEKREWLPQGIPFQTWRAITWPYIGLLFWWSAGRGIEALISGRRGSIAPRLTWVETILAALFVVGGVGALVGTSTSTPDDRSDVIFLEL